MRLRVLVSMVTLVALPEVADANMIVNGGFEEPPVPVGSVWTNQMAVAGWYTTTANAFDISRNAYGPANDGQQHADLEGFKNSNIVQNVTTIPNTKYVLTFAYSPSPRVPLASNGVQVYFNGTLVGTYQQNGVGLSTTKWTTYSITLTPTVRNSTLEFRAIGTNDTWGALIDTVTLARD